MFGPVRPTEFDLQFNLFRIPVRVLPWFWLVAVLLGYDLVHIGWQYLLVWVVVVFFSILVHEMGHALVARTFGYYPHVALYHFGGLAMFTPGSDYSAGRSILISFAGPGAGLMLGGLTFATTFLLVTSGVQLTPLTEFTIEQLLWVNIAWSLLNLLPVFPLDGGQITREVCTSMNPRHGEVWALWIALIVAGIISLGAFSIRQTYIGILFALMCYQNFQMLQMRRHWR